MKKHGLELVSIDEIGFAESMPRTHGYALKGLRYFGSHALGKGKLTNADHIFECLPLLHVS